MTSEAPPAVDRTKPGWWKEYYQRNKAKVQARNKAWLEKNKEKMLPKLRAKWKRNQIKNRERKKAQKAARRKLNPVPFRTSNKNSQKRCWTKRQAYARAYYQKHKERLKKRCIERYQENKPRAYEYAQKRRALKMKATVNLKSISEFRSRVKSKPFIACYYCEKIVSTKAIHFDHIVPLIKGGSHSVENLCVSCPTCNLTKNASTIKTWFKMGQQILNL
jgi:5-methylcytosine-specific restriction endonuclease McrA